MQKVIYPQEVINITQRYSEAHRAWDIAGGDTGVQDFYAPCDVTITAILPYETTGYYNTIICSSYTEVLCEDGIPRVLSFSLTHMNDSDFKAMNYYVGKSFNQGELMYKEGITGLAFGNHVHMCVGEGIQTKYVKTGTQYHLDHDKLSNGNSLIGVVFSRYETQTIKNANGYTFKIVEYVNELYDVLAELDVLIDDLDYSLTKAQEIRKKIGGD